MSAATGARRSTDRAHGVRRRSASSAGASGSSSPCSSSWRWCRSGSSRSSSRRPSRSPWDPPRHGASSSARARSASSLLVALAVGRRLLVRRPGGRERAAARGDALPSPRALGSLPRASRQRGRGDAPGDRGAAHRVRHRRDAGDERLRFQRSSRRGCRGRHRRRSRASLSSAAPGRGRPRVRAYPLRQLRHGDRELPSLRHLLVARRQPRRSPDRRLGRVGDGRFDERCSAASSSSGRSSCASGSGC